MSNLQIAALAYGFATLVYLAPTYIEGQRVGGQWSAHRIVGLILCLFWPVLTAIVIYKAAAATSKPKLVFVDHAATTQCPKPAWRLSGAHQLPSIQVRLTITRHRGGWQSLFQASLKSTQDCMDLERAAAVPRSALPGSGRAERKKLHSIREQAPFFHYFSL